MLFSKRLRNSSRTVEVSKIVSGDRPSERQPFQSGMKVHPGDEVALRDVDRGS